MIDEGLLDLDSRKGKAPGGYCETLHHRGRPFIFMNAVGLVDDVMTLLHEAGHAFHAFAAHEQPLIWQRHPGSEAAELASMSMELLAGPYLAQAGRLLHARRTHRSAWLEHLEDVLLSLPHIASVDAFQHWIYTSGERRRCGGARRRLAPHPRALRAGRRLERARSSERVARWYRQLHIFLYPFYYIEYGIAQIGALQVWRNSRRDQARAVAEYRGALALGAVHGLPEIYRAAGAELTFDAEEARRAGAAGRGRDRAGPGGAAGGLVGLLVFRRGQRSRRSSPSHPHRRKPPPPQDSPRRHEGHEGLRRRVHAGVHNIFLVVFLRGLRGLRAFVVKLFGAGKGGSVLLCGLRASVVKGRRRGGPSGHAEARMLLPTPAGQDSVPSGPGSRRRVRRFPQRREWMAKEEGIEMEGVVTEVLPDRNYRVMLENGHEILAYAAGKMSKFKIRVLEGDRVSVVLSPYDLTRGRVIYRHK